MKQSQYNQMPAVWSQPNAHSTFIHKNFTVTHLVMVCVSEAENNGAEMSKKI
jgi:hypothetical protein